MIDFRKLVKAGVHFGHQTSRWVPKMEPYIWGVKNKVHLIDVSKTAHQLERSALFLKGVTASGKQILWVGTKKSARDIVQEIATQLDQPFVNHRWVGGTLSNFGQVKKSVTRLLHFEDVLEKSEKYPHYTKKELSEVQKNVERLKSIVGGIRKLNWPIGAIVLVDVNKEHSALREAVSVGVPVVALVDTNADPSNVDYVIPGNDDAPRAIRVILEHLAAAVEEGKKSLKKDHKADAVQKDKKEAATPVEKLEAAGQELAETFEEEFVTEAGSAHDDDADENLKKKMIAKKAVSTGARKKSPAGKQQKAE